MALFAWWAGYDDGGSVGQLLYTGDWNADRDALHAAANANEGFMCCWEQCMADMNKQALALASGLGTFAGKSYPAWPFPKAWAKGMGFRMSGASKFTSIARLMSQDFRSLGDKQAAKFWSKYANALKGRGAASGTQAARLASAAKAGGIVLLYVEVALSAYCSHKCAK